MRIAMIHTPLTVSAGGERQMLNLSIELEKRGHEVEVFTNALDPERCFPDLLPSVSINVVPHPIRGLYCKGLFGMWRIGKIVAKGDFDIINNHNPYTEWAVYSAKRSVNIPAVWMCNEPPFWFFMPEARRGINKIYWPLYELFDKHAVRCIDEIVVLSHLMGDIVRHTYARGYEVIRSGVHLEEYEGISGESFRREYGLDDAFVMLQVGTLIHYKRQEDSIRALALLSERHEHVRLVLAGADGGDGQRLKKLARELGVAGRVLFLGPVSDAQLKELYGACDVFLFPAFQSWSLVSVEAMAAKRPVVVSSRCGISEVVEDGVSGFVIEHGSYQDMAERIELLIGDEGLKRRMGERAHELVRDNLTWQRYAERMERVFESLVG
ncbi:MAG: hypothetical protein PWR26_1391 [Methanosarcinales archaeon]|uniref:glycosyltransferase family 4 protein n=1 Tax=Methermicoccus shengliensis TaxID=660064 RepID=UPI0012F6F7EA|nr:glycosyltransferase family 4 protein [Methermicoccus shengliensis]MDI3488674.1 hypothetical protein [Methanosarcinales archaeon]MDN5295787.1 hypothetical protein [Methanosarcinales archaeon]